MTLSAIRRHLSVRGLALVGIAAGLVAVSGCQVDNALGPTNNQAIVQFINAANSYATADLFVDGVDALSGLPYGQGSSIYVNAPTTPRSFAIRSAPDTTTLASSQLVVANKGTYALILTQHASGAGLLVLPDTVSVPPTNSIGLRIVNVSPTAGAVDVYITGADSTTLTTPVATNIPFEGVTNYQNVGVGTVHLVITSAGTKTVLLDVNATALTPGQVRTFVLIDADAGGLPITWLAIPDIG
ncbi:MAG: DUF4397 domain-containing protein [Gemmatimonadaceae bacterium]